MTTNLQLEQMALLEVMKEYKDAIVADASFLALLEIKSRLDVLKELYNNSRYEELTLLKGAA